MSDAEGRAGWHSDLPRFRDTPAVLIRCRLQAFVRDAGQKQIRAWTDSIPVLQGEASEVPTIDTAAARYTATREYQLPMELRRPDVILLAGGVIVVMELKGKASPSQADLDQTVAQRAPAWFGGGGALGVSPLRGSNACRPRAFRFARSRSGDEGSSWSINRLCQAAPPRTRSRARQPMRMPRDLAHWASCMS